MDFELKQGDVIELENGEHWLYGENVSYRLEDKITTYWYNVEFDNDMISRDTCEQVVKIWRYDKFHCGFLEILNRLDSIEPSWTYNRFKTDDIVKITFYDNDIITYIVDKDGFLVSLDRAESFSQDKFPSYDRIKNSPVVSKVELMKLETVKEL